MLRRLASLSSVVLVALSTTAAAQQFEWVHQVGGSGIDAGEALARDGLGGVFVAGITDTASFGTSAGGVDVWLAHYTAAGALT